MNKKFDSKKILRKEIVNYLNQSSEIAEYQLTLIDEIVKVTEVCIETLNNGGKIMLRFGVKYLLSNLIETIQINVLGMSQGVKQNILKTNKQFLLKIYKHLFYNWDNINSALKNLFLVLTFLSILLIFSNSIICNTIYFIFYMFYFSVFYIILYYIFIL